MTTMYTLTLLDGLLAGRSLPLPPGEFSLGAEDSDIAMALEDGVTVTLHVGEEGARLMTPAAVWLDGAPLDLHAGMVQDGFAAPTLPLGTVIDLAGLGIWLSRTDGELPVPLPRRPPRVVPVDPRSSASAPMHARTTRQVRWWRPTRRRTMTWLAATLTSLAVIAAGAMIWRPGAANVITPPADTDTLKVLAARIAPGVSVAISENAVQFSGGCVPEDARAMLRAEARRLGRVVRDDSWCPADLTQSVQTLLRLYGYGSAYVGVDPGGEVVISGRFVADARWRATSDALDGLGLPRGWRVDNDDADGFDTVVQLLKDSGQLRGINITRERDGWRLTGALTPRREAALQSLADTWNDASRTLRLRIEPLPVRVPTLAETGLPAPLASIGGSPNAPHITLTDGTRLMSGARLAGGTHIVAVAADGVSIAAHERLFYLPLTPESTYDDTSDAD
ncbi:type III secretion system inner membrane ring subunit SctD [Pandoraea pneumonica]|uniref:type III secretion system inner membrane ring subunit SctD n=1 Tax=Pandoraea pneumonica TaxID=2508299 RepID=UPI003CF146C6